MEGMLFTSEAFKKELERVSEDRKLRRQRLADTYDELVENEKKRAASIKLYLTNQARALFFKGGGGAGGGAEVDKD